MTLASEARQVAKVQKNFLIPEELAAIIDRIIERSGSNFTKIATAALLQYIFDFCEHPEDAGPIVCPANQWMSRASRLDRGAVTVADLPHEVLKEAIESAKHMLDMDKTGNLKEGRADHWKKALSTRKMVLQGWENDVEDYKGAMPAILASIDDFYRLGCNR